MAITRARHALWRRGEFAILLPATTREGARLVAQRVLDAVAAARIAHGASPLGAWVTLSIGVACIAPSMAAKPASLTRRADMALYQAKAQGRAGLVLEEMPL